MSTLIARPAPRRGQADERHALIAIAQVRLIILLGGMTLAFLALIGKIAVIGLFPPPRGAPGALATPPTRADLVDRNGEPLARTIEAWRIGVQPRKLLGDRHALAVALSGLMPAHDAAWFYRRLTMPVKFTYLEKNATGPLVNQVRALGEPALVFAHERERLYPQTTLAAHVLGYIGRNDKDATIRGQAGVERALEPALMADRQGQPIALSIDARVQAAMEEELGRAMLDFKAKDATGIVLDVRTGEIIALVSLPVYNPNDLASASKDALRNNVTQSVYELGSTFKPITVAAAIDSGVITSMKRRFDATEPIEIAHHTIHDDPGDEQRRWLNIPETLVYSSNIATARIADEIGEERLSAMFRQMGFDKRPTVELVERAGPMWPRYWTPRATTTTMTAGFGHGISVTPLHLANAYAALVNGGIWRPSTLLKIAPGQAPAGRRVISEATSARMRQLLRLVVLQGTGRSGEAPGYRVGGKTGTAEIVEDGVYSKKANVSTFAAAFPMDDPRYVVVAMLDSPVGNAASHGATTAAHTAAPVVSRVIARTGSMLGVMPDMRRDIDVSELAPLVKPRPGKALAGVE